MVLNNLQYLYRGVIMSDDKQEEGYTDEEWLDICYLEMNAHHNDGWTMKWYREQYEETKKKIEEKK